MQDDRDRLGRKVSGPGKSPVVNETKPYAGEGGMKKLLARRKLELEEGEENDQSKDTSSISVSLDLVPGSDRFSTVASAPGERSLNLRVGRSQSFRSHPRPYKANFSAKFDEEPDDASEKANYQRQKHREMLKEAAKKAPAELPTDFSFAKNVSTPFFKRGDLY
jgi:nucleoporin NUP1